jgi:hypothetical protein
MSLLNEEALSLPEDGSNPRSDGAGEQDYNSFVLEVRRETIALLLKAAQGLEVEPDNPDHIYQINYCARNYVDAQMILKPNFFG